LSVNSYQSGVEGTFLNDLSEEAGEAGEAEEVQKSDLIFNDVDLASMGESLQSFGLYF
jgi:hypothetical protein